MTVIGEAFVAVRPDSQSFAADAKKQLDPAAQQVARDFTKTLASAAVGLGIGRALLGGAEANNEAQKALAQTANVIRTTGGVANVTADQVTELSERLSDQIAVDDDLIRSSANLLLTFTKVRNEVGEGNDVFDRAVALSQDMAAALGTDASGAAIQLGKALNDPLKGITALSRAGVSFTAEQKDMIRGLVETGDLLGAQRVILDELAVEFEGSAAAQATSLDKIKVAANEVSEQIGAGLEPGLKIVAAVARGAAGALELVPAPLQAILLGAGGIVALARPLNETIQLLRTLGIVQSATTVATTAGTTAVAGQALVMNDATAVTGLYTASTTRAAAAQKLLAQGAGILATAFVAVTIAQEGINRAQEDGARIAAGFDDQLRGATGFEDLQRRFSELVDQRNAALFEASSTANWNDASDIRAAVNEIDPLIAQYQNLGVVIRELSRTSGNTLDESTQIVLGNVDTVITALEDGYSPAVAGARAEEAEWARQQEETSAEIGDFEQSVSDATSTIEAYIQGVTDARDAIAELGSEQRRAVNAGIAFRESQRTLADVGERVAEQQLTGQERLDEYATAISRGLADVEAYTQGLIDQGVSASEAALRGQDLVNQLFATADQAGLTRDEVAFLRGEFGLLPDQVDVELRTNLAIELERVRALRDELAALGSGAVVDVMGTRLGQPHAVGGFAAAGVPIPVGEAGREVFVPGADGAILSADRTAGLATRDDLTRVLAAVRNLAAAGGRRGALVETLQVDARGLSVEQAGRLVGDELLWRFRES